MKTTILKFFTLSAAIFAFSTISFGQANNATGTAQASANIVTPISITKNIDLNFGNIAASGSAFTVELSTAGERTSNGGAGTLPSVNGTVAAAEFTVAGLTDATYAVTLPSSITIKDGGETNTMTVDNFVSNSTFTLTGGSETFNVGATLNVGANQVAGAYSGNFNVTVNYN